MMLSDTAVLWDPTYREATVTLLRPLALLGLLPLAGLAISCSASAPSFLNGIDENYYLQQGRTKSYTDNGRLIPPEDLPYRYFAAKGVNFARIRCWVGENKQGNYENALANARAARHAGVKTLLVIFLSDGWTAYKENDAAAIFRDLPYEQRRTAVRDYCRDLVRRFERDGVRFDLYAVGNEIDAGICGESTRARVAGILNASYQGVRQVDPRARFVLHVARSGRPAWLCSYFGSMLNRYGVAYDYASVSFYPVGMGGKAFDLLKRSVEDIYALTNRPVIISEWAYPDSYVPTDRHWGATWGNHPVDGYPQTPQGQADLVRDLLAWGRRSPALAGVFYWSPMLNTDEGLWGWVWFSLFDLEGKAKPAVDSLSHGAASVRQ
jgi:arabinogalactan endo-1,4-beta-galactosidase